mmetsp:Transcript_47838/g.144704  ORF Transcript_47838/g.144704 Transcript_47838/m.144704 type:complete len:89 (-) Transcript_47838:600-866(-)
MTISFRSTLTAFITACQVSGLLLRMLELLVWGSILSRGIGRPDAEFPHDHQSGGNKLSLELTQQDHRALDSITQDEYKAFGWYFDSNK